jgi:hypothetical protein
MRPALILDRVHDAAISGLSVEGNAAAESALRLINAQQVLLSSPRLLGSAKVYLRVEGAHNDGLILEGGDLTRAEQPVAFANGAPKSSVRMH